MFELKQLATSDIRSRRPGFGAPDQERCDNLLTILRDEVEARVLSALQDKLLRKGLFEEFCREFAKEMNRLPMKQGANITSAKRELPGCGLRKKLIDLVLDDLKGI